MTANQPQCLTCGADGEGTLFPLLPKSPNKFGEVCQQCDDESPWIVRPLVCVDCEEELSIDEAWGNRKYGEPRCQECHYRYEDACPVCEGER